ADGTRASIGAWAKDCLFSLWKRIEGRAPVHVGANFVGRTGMSLDEPEQDNDEREDHPDKHGQGESCGSESTDSLLCDRSREACKRNHPSSSFRTSLIFLVSASLGSCRMASRSAAIASFFFPSL